MELSKDKNDSVSMDLYDHLEEVSQKLKRTFTPNEKLKLKNGKPVKWKNMDFGGEKKEIELKLQTFINEDGKLEKAVALRVKADKLEIPDSIMDHKLNSEEKESLTNGDYFSLERESGTYLVKVDTKVNSVIIRTPGEVGIREELGGYRFDKNEIGRLANGEKVGPKVYHSEKYGDFIATLDIKQQGLSNEYTYSNIVNLTEKEAEIAAPWMNNNKGEWSEESIDKIMDTMGIDSSKRPEMKVVLQESKKEGLAKKFTEIKKTVKKKVTAKLKGVKKKIAPVIPSPVKSR